MLVGYLNGVCMDFNILKFYCSKVFSICKPTKERLELWIRGILHTAVQVCILTDTIMNNRLYYYARITISIRHCTQDEVYATVGSNR